VTIGGEQKHLEPVESVMHSSPSLGQSPPQVGAVVFSHATTTGSQRQNAPSGVLLQTSPTGQTPPHSGAAAWLHGTSTGLQMQEAFKGLSSHK
jgi:hypothetical protein